MTTKKQEPEHAARGHHPFSPSSLSLREECPCYESANTSSEAAERGTKQHEAVELQEDNEFLHDHEAIAVAACLDYAESVKKDYGNSTKVLEFNEAFWPIDGNKIKVGKEVWQGTTAGYADKVFVAADFRCADVLDWKFGAFEVTDASENLQGMSYMLGVVRKFPRLPRVTVHFPMPHRDEITYHTFTREDFPKAYLRIKHVVYRAIQARKTGFKMATPSASACLFCKHLGVCPAVNKLAIKLGKKVNPIDVPETVTPELIADPKETGAALKLCAVVERWAKHYRQSATAKAIDELDFIPEGYTLVTGQRREIQSVSGVREKAKEFGLTAEEIDSSSEVHVGKIETIIKAKTPRGGKEAAAKEFSDALLEAGYVEKGTPYGYLKQSRGVKRRNKPSDE